MEEKVRLTILIDPAKKKAFEALCSALDVTTSQMMRQLIREHLEKHGVAWRSSRKGQAPMRVPAKGEQLTGGDGAVWVVLRCHHAPDDPAFFAVDLIRQQDLKQTSRALNLTWDEFADFCRQQGIAYPPP